MWRGVGDQSRQSRWLPSVWVESPSLRPPHEWSAGRRGRRRSRTRRIGPADGCAGEPNARRRNLQPANDEPDRVHDRELRRPRDRLRDATTGRTATARRTRRSRRSRRTPSASTRCSPTSARSGSTRSTSGARTSARLGDRRARRGGARGARAGTACASRPTRPGSSPANVERACEIALALGTTIDRRRFLGRPGGDRARCSSGTASGSAIENHPETDAGGDARADRERGRHRRVRHDGRHGLVGDARLRRGAAIEELGEHVLHVHLKDVRAVGEPHETCRWGEGVVPIEECVRTLQRHRLRGRDRRRARAGDARPDRGRPRDAGRARGVARVKVALVGAGNIAARYAKCIAAQPRLDVRRRDRRRRRARGRSSSRSTAARRTTRSTRCSPTTRSTSSST